MTPSDRRSISQKYFPTATGQYEAVDRGTGEPVHAASSLADLFAWLFDMNTGEGGTNKFAMKKKPRRWKNGYRQP